MLNMEKCSDCGDNFEFGPECYIGPVDMKDDRCDPFMEFMSLCPDCFKKRKEKEGVK